MKILHLISQHPESTGSGYYLGNVLRQAAAANHTNFLVAGLSGSMQVALDGCARDHCRFVRFGQDALDFAIPGMSDVMPYPSSRFSELDQHQLDYYESAFAQTIDQAVRDFQPDVIHSHHLWLATAVARQRFPLLPLVTSCHSTDLRQFIQCPHLRERVYMPCRTIPRILALSADQKRQISTLYAIPETRIDIVGAGFDPKLFNYREKPSSPPVHLLYAGKLSYAKGVDRLLQVFDTLREFDLHLHLAGSGSGEEADHCLGLAARLGDRVTIHGRLDQRELARLMAKSHLFILPSWFEGLPLVLLEALSCGCRIITTDLPGSRELLGEAEGDLVRFISLPAMLTVDRPDPKALPLFDGALANAIKEMSRATQRAGAPCGQEIEGCITPYHWRHVFTRIEAAYKTVLKG